MMLIFIKVLISLIIGYFLGSINTSIIVSKAYGIDIREHGSKNAGMTNILRTLGKFAAFLTIVGDVFKSIISCLIGLYVVGYVGGAGNLGLMAGGIGAVVGHIWPIYFGFRGGKGVLSSISVVFMMNWKIGLVLMVIFLVLVLVTRYVSLGSTSTSLLFPVVASFYGESAVFIIFASILAILVIVMHRSNIRRLIKGEESKIGIKSRAK